MMSIIWTIVGIVLIGLGFMVAALIWLEEVFGTAFARRSLIERVALAGVSICLFAAGVALVLTN